MTSNSSHAARTVSPINVAVYVFAASQIIAIPLPHAIIAAAAIGGGYAAYQHLPESFREKAGGKYAQAKSLLREHLNRASCKIKQRTRHAVIRIQKFVANGVLIVLILAAFVGETFRQFVEMISLCAEVCAGAQEPLFATVEEA
jgi:hypothetical protein